MMDLFDKLLHAFIVCSTVRRITTVIIRIYRLITELSFYNCDRAQLDSFFGNPGVMTSIDNSRYTLV